MNGATLGREIARGTSAQIMRDDLNRAAAGHLVRLASITLVDMALGGVTLPTPHEFAAGGFIGRPSCFRSRPGPQQRAENGCDDCPVAGECLQ